MTLVHLTAARDAIAVADWSAAIVALRQCIDECRRRRGDTAADRHRAALLVIALRAAVELRSWSEALRLADDLAALIADQRR